jgi:hypothetical protein
MARNYCKTCDYCQVVNEEKSLGKCRINPPTVIVYDIDMATVFPKVDIHKDWCGSHTESTGV